MAVNGVAAAAVAAGCVFTWAGLKGVSVPAVIQTVVQGKSPTTVPQSLPIDAPIDIPGTGTTAGTVGPGSASGQAIANDALKYVGTGYVYGGPADKPGDWDCSSFMFYVLAKDFGMSIPGFGTYGSAGCPPHAHGPVTTDFLQVGTAVPFGQQQAGDLLIWHPHCAFAISATQMISAQDEQLGTGVASIAGAVSYFGAQPQVRRVGA